MSRSETGRVTWIISGVPASPDNHAQSDGTCAYLSLGGPQGVATPSDLGPDYPSPWNDTGDLWLTEPVYSWSTADVVEERDWLATALADQEAAYAALEQQYLGLVDQYGALIDQVTKAIAGGKA